MIFKRRDKRLTFLRIKEFLLPKKGWKRALDYVVYRLKRLPDTPHKISVGLAMGVFSSFTPFFGFHLVVAGVLAYVFNGNIVAALLGTFFGNPITWPFIASLSVNLGQILLGRELSNFETVLEQFIHAGEAIWQGFKAAFGSGQSDWDFVFLFFNQLLLPYFVGGLLLGAVVSLLSYLVFRPIIYAYQKARAKKKRKKIRRFSRSESSLKQGS